MTPNRTIRGISKKYQTEMRKVEKGALQAEALLLQLAAMFDFDGWYDGTELYELICEANRQIDKWLESNKEGVIPVATEIGNQAAEHVDSEEALRTWWSTHMPRKLKIVPMATSYTECVEYIKEPVYTAPEYALLTTDTEEEPKTYDYQPW